MTNPPLLQRYHSYLCFLTSQGIVLEISLTHENYRGHTGALPSWNVSRYPVEFLRRGNLKEKTTIKKNPGMIPIGQFFFKYRNLLFPVFALTIFIPSPDIFNERLFGNNYYHIPLIAGLTIALTGQLIRALTIALKYIVRGGLNKKVYATDLVTEGMFNHCRNPLYIGNILMLGGVGLLSNSLYFIVFVVPVFCFIYQAIVLAEENFLLKKFGPQYEMYCLRVNRWIPQFNGLLTTISGMDFNWRRYVIFEYNTVYLLLLSIYIVLLNHHPSLVKLSDDEKIRMSLVVFLILSMLYSFVRFLKKSKRLVSHT